MLKVIFLCVNYNSYDALQEYLESINAAKQSCKNEVELKVIVGDNSQKSHQINTGKYDFQVEQIIFNQNTGYFGGISSAIKKSDVKLKEYSYIIISNVDVKVATDFFEQLYIACFNDDIGCIAPSILSRLTGENRNPRLFHRYSLKKINILRIMYKIPFVFNVYLRCVSPIKSRFNKVNVAETKIIYAPHGSFMIFTKKFADFLQTMKFPSFLYGEEIFIGEELKKRKLKTVYYPPIKVFDEEHISTGKMKNRILFKYNYDSLTSIVKEYYQHN